MTAWFDPLKAAQVAHYFCDKAGGELNVVKLVKLIYLADRVHMKKYGFPILNDRLVSMPHGPVNSLTYNYIGGNLRSAAWADYIADKADHKVARTAKRSEEELDALSAAELKSLKSIWKKFGQMDPWELRDWTHDHCPEWEDPQGSSSGIPHARVLKFLKVDDATHFADEIENERTVDELFASFTE